MATLSETLVQYREAILKGDRASADEIKSQIFSSNQPQPLSDEVVDFATSAQNEAEAEIVKDYFSQNILGEFSSNWRIFSDIFTRQTFSVKNTHSLSLLTKSFHSLPLATQKQTIDDMISKLDENKVDGIIQFFSEPNIWHQSLLDEVHYSASEKIQEIMISQGKVSAKAKKTQDAMKAIRSEGLTQEKLLQYKEEGADVEKLFEICCLEDRAYEVDLFLKQERALNPQAQLSKILSQVNPHVFITFLANNIPMNKPFSQPEDIHFYGLTPFMWLIFQTSNQRLIEILLRSDVDIAINYKVPAEMISAGEMREETALSYALKKGKDHLVRWLLDLKADATLPENKPIFYAYQSGKFQFATLLFQRGATLTQAQTVQLIQQMPWQPLQNFLKHYLGFNAEASFFYEAFQLFHENKIDAATLFSMIQDKLYLGALHGNQWPIVSRLLAVGYNPTLTHGAMPFDKSKAYGEFLLAQQDLSTLSVLGATPNILAQEWIDQLYLDKENIPQLQLENNASIQAKNTVEAIATLSHGELSREKLESYQSKEGSVNLHRIFLEVCTQGKLKEIDFLDIFQKGNVDFNKILLSLIHNKEYHYAEYFMHAANAVLPVEDAKVLLLQCIKHKDFDRFVFLLLKTDAYLLLDEVKDNILYSMSGQLYELLYELQSKEESYTEKSMEREASGIKLIRTRIDSAFEFKKALATHMYSWFVEDLSKFFVMQPKIKKATEKFALPELKDIRVITNNDGYDMKMEAAHLRGNPLLLEQVSTPIGYNIHLPPVSTAMKGVMVEVYGGYDVHDGDYAKFKPGNLGALQNYLLMNGVVFITLNLPDLLKLKVDQSRMPFDLHAEIHACIEKFYRTLTQNPGLLHESLSSLNLEKQPIFLFGKSFGGAMAIRHAELYPHTFNGYISHDGFLSNDMFRKSDRGRRPFYVSWLDPAQPCEVDKLEDLLLLLQSRDDNNVNAKVTFEFYKILQSRFKSHLASVGITEVGNPLDPKEIYNKGHYIPTERETFLRYAQSLLDFMQNGPAANFAMTRWQVYKQDLLANKFYKSATPIEKFIAEVLEQARHDETSELKLREFKSQLSSQKADELWNEHYKRLYGIVRYIEKLKINNSLAKSEIERLERLGYPTDEMIQKALLWQSESFSQLLKEYLGVDFSPTFLTENTDIIRLFREILFSIPNKDDIYSREMMFNSLFFANPELIAPLMVEFEQDKAFIEEAEEAKKALKHSLMQQRKLITNVYRQAVKETLQKNLQQALKCIEFILHDPLSHQTENVVLLLKLTTGIQKNKGVVEQALDKAIKALSEFAPKTEDVVLNLLSCRVVKAMISGDQSKIEEAKIVSLAEFVKARNPEGTSDEVFDESRHIIDTHYKALIERSSLSPLKIEKSKPTR